jgi:hypothetical protein
VTIIADRGLFVRLPVQSGRFEQAAAESFADALDAAAKEPATKAGLAELQAEVALLGQRLDAKIDERFQRLDAKIDGQAQRLDARIDAQTQRLGAKMDGVVDKLLVRLGGLMIALMGALFAALRLTSA